MAYHLRDLLGKRIDELEALDIIEKVDGPSSWVSPVVTIPKGNYIRLCMDMCQFAISKLEFMGHMLSDRGIGPTASRMKAVMMACQPHDALELQSFLGLVNYSARFISHHSMLTEPLRQVTEKAVCFKWGPRQADAVGKMKEEMTKVETLAYFDSMQKPRL